MWSPGVLLRWMVPCTWPLASVTAWVGSMLASPPGSMTMSRSTGAPAIGLPNAIRVTVKSTDPPGALRSWVLLSLRLTGPGGGDGLVNGTNPCAMTGPEGLGAISPGVGVVPALLDDALLLLLEDDGAGLAVGVGSTVKGKLAVVAPGGVTV